MTWSIEFLEEAEKDMKKLDHSAQIQVLKGITKVSKNPLPAEEGGYGKPLGNKSGINLTNLLKIKFRDLGIRAVSSEFQLSCCTTWRMDRLCYIFYLLYVLEGAAINFPFF